MTSRLLILAACCLPAFVSAQAPADDGSAARSARWVQLQHAIFPNREIHDGNGVIQLDAPLRALDAALVPLTVTVVGGKPVKTIHLIIDNNPGPLAGRFTFGPGANPRTLKVRMRVNTYTNIHAVAEDADGRLYSVEKFVKAAGGCSAPAGSDDAKSLEDLGKMRLKLLDEFAVGKPLQAQLMIRHPNFNGMQMNQITRLYTPAHFIKTIDINYEGEHVLHVESDIALSTDPVISFGFVPRKPGHLQVVVEDSEGRRFEHGFDVPSAMGAGLPGAM
jgi:sulfur-oxidizing protein SoxY